MPNGVFNICCPRDCVTRYNGGASGAPLKSLRVDSALRALSNLFRKKILCVYFTTYITAPTHQTLSLLPMAQDNIKAPSHGAG